MERFAQFAVAAARQALEDSSPRHDKGRSVPCRCLRELRYRKLTDHRRNIKLLEKGPGRVNPLLVLMISNNGSRKRVHQFGLKGKNINVVTACASGTNSIGEAMRAIQHGEAEVMVAGGTESCITPLGVAGFSGLTALSTSEDPERASIPFDLERNGFVMGEGAGVVVLEELEHAKARGARSRVSRIRSDRRCLSHYFSGGGRKRCRKGNGIRNC